MFKNRQLQIKFTGSYKKEFLLKYVVISVCYQIVKADDVFDKAEIGYPHTSHCLADGNIMISGMGDRDGNGKGEFPFEQG